MTRGNEELSRSYGFVHVLQVEQDPEAIAAVAGFLFPIKECRLQLLSSYQKTLDLLNDIAPDLVIFADGLEGKDGQTVLKEIHKKHPLAYVIVRLSAQDESLISSYRMFGANECLSSGKDYPANLVRSVQAAVMSIVENKSFAGTLFPEVEIDGDLEEDAAEPEAEPSVQVGESVLHYEIQHHIAEGGMGEIYKGLDTHLGRTVVLKVLPRSHTGDEVARRRFHREAKAASALNHPNIVTVYSIEETNELTFIVMEYVEGSSLAELLEKGPLPFHQALDVGAQIADALSAAHPAGLIHRDIKPGNIMVTPRGQVKLLDFGLVKKLPSASGLFSGDSSSARLTKVGIVVGTVHYMSPEQARGETLDPRADIFSLGCLLYQIATGELPFHGVNPIATMYQIFRSKPAAPSSIRTDLPKEFDRIIQKTLAKDRKQRYSSAADLAADLRSLRDTLAGSIRETVEPQSDPSTALASEEPESEEAYRLYLKGCYCVKQLTEDQLLRGMSYLEQAIVENPNDARPYGELARTYCLLGYYEYVSPQETFPKARTSAQRALDLQLTLAEAQAAVAFVRLHQWPVRKFGDLIRIALDNQPGCISVHLWNALYLAAREDFGGAMTEIKEVLRLEPLSLLGNMTAGYLLFLTRNYEKSATLFRTLLEMEPDFGPARYYLGSVMEQQGDLDRALKTFQRIPDADEVRKWSGLGHAYARGGRNDDANNVIVRLNGMAQTRYVSPFNIALIHAALENWDLALNWLEKAYDSGSPQMLFLSVDPRLDLLKAHDRFRILEKKVGLKELSE